MSNVKAIIKLATGNVGFYDNLTRIHLTIASPTAKVLKGMNVTNLENGVRCKTIEVLEGSLYDEPIVEEPSVEEEPPVIVQPEPEPELEEKEEEVVEDTPTTLEEPVIETLAKEEVVEPKKSTRKRSSKKATKETSSTEEESK